MFQSSPVLATILGAVPLKGFQKRQVLLRWLPIGWSKGILVSTTNE